MEPSSRSTEKASNRQRHHCNRFPSSRRYSSSRLLSFRDALTASILHLRAWWSVIRVRVEPARLVWSTTWVMFWSQRIEFVKHFRINRNKKVKFCNTRLHAGRVKRTLMKLFLEPSEEADKPPKRQNAMKPTALIITVNFHATKMKLPILLERWSEITSFWLIPTGVLVWVPIAVPTICMKQVKWRWRWCN